MTQKKLSEVEIIEMLVDVYNEQDNMTIEETLIQIATLQQEGKTTDKLYDELQLPIHYICYDLRNEDGSYDYPKYKTIDLVKFSEDSYVACKDCYFLYKRSIQNTMRLVGVLDMRSGLAVMGEDFLTPETEVPKSIVLYYPEFYIAENRKTVTMSDSYSYDDANYGEVGIRKIVNRREIMVPGKEGKEIYTIGFTSEVGSKDVYLYEAHY